MLTMTVSELNQTIKTVLEELCDYSDLYIRGEVSNFTHHYRSGHFYFTLKDEHAAIRAVMFRSHASALRFEPENGMQVLVRGRLGVFERDGVYQLYATDMLPQGAGAMAAAVRQLREKLAKLGWFDEARKKPLPPYPNTIGVVTSRSGAVLGDIQNVLARRYPVAKLLFCPALVQGEGAPLALANALRTLDGRCDVIIIGRGGGSEEDLWAFQSEVLAAAIVQAQTPVISAVGHQGDVTICDMVADRRAPTPSAAAELATPSARQLTETLKEAEYRLRTGAARLLDAQRARLAALAKSPALASPRHGLYIRREKLHFYSKTLYNKKRIYIQARRLSLAGRAAVLDGVSPLKVLSRGYALVSRAGRSLADAGALRVGDRVHIRLHRGAADAQITETMPEEAQYAEKETGTDI